MNFDEWEPVYRAIIADFGYRRGDDERARDWLRGRVRRFDLARLGALDGAAVVVAGAGPSLADELGAVGADDPVVAASTAVEACLDRGLRVACMVTDLDKNPRTALELSRRGVPVAVHAHGDNRGALRRWVPGFRRRNLLATTQAAPVGPVRNFGGFTDGDRAAFLADRLGAAELRFVGWDLDDPTVSAEKRHKLRWAERLLGWLERRRGDRFDVLDGRREAIDLSGPFAAGSEVE